MANILSNLPTIRRLTGIAGISPTAEPQRAYNWELWLSGKISAKLGDLRFFAKSVNIPQRTVEQIKNEMVGQYFYYPGKDTSPHTITATFWDDQNLTVLTFLHKWIDLIGNSNQETLTNKRDFFANLSVRLKDTSDLIQTCEIKLTDVFPIDINEINLSYDNSDILEISLTMSFKSMSLDGGKKFVSIADLLREVI